MVREYTERFYLPAAARQEQLAADGLARARSLAAWKERLRQQWAAVRITSVTAGELAELQVNNEIKVQAQVQLETLTPDDVAVELYLGLVNANDEIIEAQTIPMLATGAKRDGIYLFEASAVTCGRSGLHGFTVRVLPHHPDLVTPFLAGLIVWAENGHTTR
jgi:starch phosphorylase